MDYMTKLERNALRIAELMGWRYNPIFQQNTLDCNTYFADAVKISSNDELIELYSNYQGLMPIVYECNKSNVDYPINICPHQIQAYPGDALDIYNYDTEPEFIEAIQECVIKYLELKNDNSRVQQTI